ncbi:MAG TPA: phosphatidylserine/phosphatidylglycerophosphate/cardiolipin synthase family protein [Thermoanaerobaculia bacterium]|nr:phosphatidylserine/phosphatidylglycerophosphate/cardiolipin synthase family protein [Thermoanaerobaculia bacterium]
MERARLARTLRREADRMRIWRERLLTFARKEDAPLREGNVAALYGDGGALLEAWRQAIRGAERTLDVEIYFWSDDVVGQGFVELVRAALARGVAVRIAYDAVGTWPSSQHIDRLKAEGAFVHVFHPIAPWRIRSNPNHRDHRKLVIADDTIAVVGSANWSVAYDQCANPGCFIDVGLGVAGPIVRDLALDFRNVWDLETGERLPPPCEPRSGFLPPGELQANVPVQMVSGWRRGHQNAVRRLYGMLIRAARAEILLATPYFIPGRRILRALGRAASHGLSVVIVVPGAIDQPWVRAAARASYGRLLRAGARIFERQDRMIHAKVAVLDGEVAVVGTANLDPRSFLHNLELNLDVHHRPIARLVADFVAEQRKCSVEVDLETHSRRPFLTKLWQRLAYELRYWL